MTWYGMELPDASPADMTDLNALGNLICPAAREKGEGGVKAVDYEKGNGTA